VSYLLCANYPKCRCAFCFTCLATYFPDDVDSNPRKMKSQKWECVVCKKICDCQRCLDRQPKDSKKIIEEEPQIDEPSGDYLNIDEWRDTPYLENESIFKGPKDYTQIKKKEKADKPKTAKRKAGILKSSGSSDYVPGNKKMAKIQSKLAAKGKSSIDKKEESIESSSNHDSEWLSAGNDKPSEANKGITISASKAGGGKVILRGLNLCDVYKNAKSPPPAKQKVVQRKKKTPKETPAKKEKPEEKKIPSLPTPPATYTSIYIQQNNAANTNGAGAMSGIRPFSMNYQQQMQTNTDPSQQYPGASNYPMAYGMSAADQQAYQSFLYSNPGNFK